jgi:hypothetical protein
LSSVNPSTTGQSVTFTAAVAGSSGGSTPTGTVVFTDQTTSQTLGSITLSGGQAVVTTSTLARGSHTILAAYSGDGNFAPSSATVIQLVAKKSTATTLTASPNPSTPGQAVTFTATVQPTSGSGTPTGTGYF